MSQVSIETPVMTQERFAQKVGLTPDTIRGLVETNKLPSRKYGKRRLVNVAAITADCLKDCEIELTSDNE